MALALERVVAYFQPIFSADTNTVYSYEILGRYINDDGEVVSLGGFFTDERVSSQEALEVDRVVRRQGMEKYAAEGQGEYLFINMRLEWLTNTGDMSEVLIILRWAEELGIAPDRLVIEITEEEFNADNDEHMEALNAYKKAGCRIAIDDYGKNASNIDRLAMLSPDIMKIDMDYIHKSENSYHYREYLRSLTAFAECVGIEVLYEGVETEQQLNICMASRGRYYQGFLLAPPQPSIRDAAVNRALFVSSSDHSFEVLQNNASQANNLRGALDTQITDFLTAHPFQPGETDTGVYVERLCGELPDSAIHAYLCDKYGYQLTYNVVHNPQNAQNENPREKNWAWRGYYQETLTALAAGEKSYLSTAYRDVATKQRVFTYVYAISEDLFLLIDILRLPYVIRSPERNKMP
ncbi:MAG: EAL domain-containing protein [Peptococcaceae bacterium]|jgi:EAL domain-containing protein (putative c-di-GMP-specific phosphodiesterase class I)|nr:EAL domain-containing protein [Peptococcaceae bacterium]